MKFLLAALLAVWALPAAEEAAKAPITGQHFRVFRGDGKPASVDDVVAAAQRASVTFLGENHDDPVAHYLEMEIFRQVAGPDTVLSLEMFERDVQHVVNEYLAGLISEEHLLLSGRAWKNYKTDYRPLVELAKERRIPVIAANAPRRYVNRVSRMGKDSLRELDKEAKRTLPPLPYAEASAAYAEKFEKVMAEARAARGGTGPAPAGPPRDPKWALQAQSLWDASMAESIAQIVKKNGNARVVHVNGSFHTEQHLGIVEHLRGYRSSVQPVVVTMRPEKKFTEWDGAKFAGLGDFVILTDAGARGK